MSCYSPMVAEWTGSYTSNGKKQYKFVGRWLDPRYKEPGQDQVVVPCGKCIGCRLDYSRNWADRMMLELDSMKKGVFVTLTYKDPPVTFDGLYNTLDKKDCQTFMKEIRRKFKGVRIRFFLSGEYGSQSKRPHYHLILFGISLDDFPDKRPYGRNDMGNPYFISDWLSESVWKKGFCLMSDVSWETCAYVARYTLKKLDVDMPDELFQHGVVKEFSLMSRRPGIGGLYLQEHPDCLDYVQIPVSGKMLSVPKYFLRIKEKEDPVFYEDLRTQRKKFAEDKILSKLLQTDLDLKGVCDAERTAKENSTRIFRKQRKDL